MAEVISDDRIIRALEGVAAQGVQLKALEETVRKLDEHWTKEFEFVVGRLAETEARAIKSEKTLDAFKIRGGTIMTVFGLAATSLGAVIGAKASGLLASIMHWLQAAPPVR